MDYKQEKMKLKVGMTGSFSKTITEYDVYTFAGISGDFNPIHINEEAAKGSMFRGRVAHGMLCGGLISAVIGNRMPGPGSIYLEQDLKFKAPVYFNDTCTATVVVSEVLNENKGIYKLKTDVTNQNKVLICEGYAIIKYQNEVG